MKDAITKSGLNLAVFIDFFTFMYYEISEAGDYSWDNLELDHLAIVALQYIRLLGSF